MCVRPKIYYKMEQLLQDGASEEQLDATFNRLVELDLKQVRL